MLKNLEGDQYGFEQHICAAYPDGLIMESSARGKEAGSGHTFLFPLALVFHQCLRPLRRISMCSTT